MRTLGPLWLPVRDLGGHSLTVFRAVPTDDPDMIVERFRSNYERGNRPRGIETKMRIMHLGLSVYRQFDAARDTAIAIPQIGSFVAELHLQPDFGFNYAETGQPSHLTLWGDPVKLSDAIVDVQPV